MGLRDVGKQSKVGQNARVLHVAVQPFLILGFHESGGDYGLRFL